ncbi:MAG: ABC transporter ATP-binding protein [Pseudomonadota bacterium]
MKDMAHDAPPGRADIRTEPATKPTALAISGASKTYPGASGAALSNVSLDIAENEFFTLLGPSGCGKTTLLRAIAGFEDLSAGSISLHGERIDALAPNLRSINTVFQHYALFPHMSVQENVAYPLRRLGWSRAETETRVREMLSLVQLEQLAERMPAKLSGGQQQRIALARALAPNPKLLLLDEPLSALDLKLRREMRAELKRIQVETGITFLFVTHDQEEALAMSDRVAVMFDGALVQIGSPEDIYNRPFNAFVATFIGETNLLPGRVERSSTGRDVVTVLDSLELCCPPDADVGQAVLVSVRLERVAIHPAGATPIAGVVEASVFLGTDRVVDVRVGEHLVQARVQQADGAGAALGPGDLCSIGIDAGAATVLSSELA